MAAEPAAGRRAARVRRLLEPDSVALVGGTEAARVVRQCRKTGFAGEIWPVNPNRETLEGIRCFPSLSALPRAPDAAFVAIPAEATVGCVAELREMGAGGAVCYASGFGEMGAEGARLQERLAEAAGDLPVLGPNCHGYLNLLSGAALWPDQFGHRKVDRGVAIVTQSGNIGISLTMQRRGLPLAWMVTLGNQVSVGVEECVSAALGNASITAVGAHVEALRDLPRFVEAAELARRLGKPIVVIKAGRSDAGARIALGHTASLAGEAALYDALFERLGVACVADLETFTETLKLLAACGTVGGNRMVSLSCSGGEASLMADLAETTGLEFPRLPEARRDAVARAFGGNVIVDNPLDYHTHIWGDKGRMVRCFSEMLAGDFDFAFFVLDYPRGDQCDQDPWRLAVGAFTEAAAATGRKAALVATLAEGIPEDIAIGLAGEGVAPLCGMPQALAAVDAARRVGAAWRAPLPPPAPPAPGAERRTAAAGTVAVDEWEAKRTLAAGGLRVPDGAVAESVGDALAAARGIGYPVAVKALSAGLAHKTEAGAVTVGVAGDAALEREAARLLGRFGKVLVERTVTGAAAELLVGVRRDALFGDHMVVAAGGTLAELLADRRVLLFPVDREQVRAALEGLRAAPLLSGHRGAPPADLDAAVDAALALASHPGWLDGTIAGAEINPLLVLPRGGAAAGGAGAWVADALVRLAPGGDAGEKDRRACDDG